MLWLVTVHNRYVQTIDWSEQRPGRRRCSPAALGQQHCGGDRGVLNLHVSLRLSTGDSLPSLPEHAPALALAALLSDSDGDFRVLCFPHQAGPAHAFVNLTRACSFACVLRGKMMMMMDNARPCFEPPPLLALI
jgi:hypothetical protein